MENISKSALEPKLFKIPFEKYKEDIDTEQGKEKKKEIRDLFKNYNHLHSIEEFNEIEYKLHAACRKGELELIKIYLSETIENETKDLIFKIDKANQTASLFKVNSIVNDQLIIPQFVKHESTDYLITSISGICSNLYTENPLYIKTIKFVEDSKVKTIYNGAFSSSKVNELYLPESLCELKEGWCYDTKYLNKIVISPLNNRFLFKEENKYLLGKSDQNKEEFDILLFACRYINEISIPSNIKIISSFAFEYCECLTKIKIPTNSDLQTIEENAFSSSKIEELYLPESLCELKEGWCYDTKYLNKIVISPLNNRFLFKEENKYLLGKSDQNKEEFDILLFACRDINEISIPSNIKIISSFAFEHCRLLTKIKISTNSNLQTIEQGSFSNSLIKEIFIPSKVTKICEFAFECCECLTKIKIPTNSDLQIIENNAFSSSKIEELYLPESLCELKEGWCYDTKYLNKIVISPLNNRFLFKEENKYLLGKSDQNKEEFDILLFACRDIKKIFIPSKVTKICEFAFEYCEHLTKIEIPTNSNLQIIEENAFSYSTIEEIFIPSKVTKICEFAFIDCRKLRKISFQANSNLQIIEDFAFSGTKIEEVYIPPNVSKICGDVFSFCDKLKYVQIPANSNLQIIKSYAFQRTSIKEIVIPPKVSKICENAFDNCDNLQIIEISEESILESLLISSFSDCPQIIIIMIPSSLRKLII